MKTPALAAPLVLALLLSLAPPLQAATPAQAAARGGAPALSPMPGEVIVRFKPEASVMRRSALAAGAAPAGVAQVLAQRASSLGARTGRLLQAGPAVGERTQLVRAAGVDAAELARQLAADPEVEWAEPNGRRRVLTAPNDPLYGPATALNRPSGPDSGQWYLRAPTAEVVSGIDIEAAWARTRGSANVVVAVLDTGVRFQHPDLGRVASGGKLLDGHDFVSDREVANDGDGRDADPSDPGDWISSDDRGLSKFSDCELSPSSWHGTVTSSLVGARTDDGVGMAGTAPGVNVLPVRVLGKCFGTDADIQAGMRWAAGLPVDGVPTNPHPARVLNMSLGSSGSCTASYQAAVDDVLAAGAVIVAAAGNSAGGPVGVPGNCRGVIAVLALRHAGTKVGFSDLGPEIGIAAPGGNCVNIGPGDACVYPILAATDLGARGPVESAWTNSFDITVGTSFSSPLVAGVAGLMFSQQPALSPADVRQALQATARPFPTSGADNGSDPTPVAQCQPPRTDANGNTVEQLQCYCTTALCGAGMLDAGAAVAAVAGLLARIDVTPAAPVAGTAVQLSANRSVAGSGRQITLWAWTLLDGGGVTAGFSTASNAATAAFLPTAAGTVRVRLTVTDDLGQQHSTEQSVAVAAAPSTPGLPGGGTGGGGGGGGGAMSLLWLLLLAAAAAVLMRKPRRG
jgi:serine protease